MQSQTRSRSVQAKLLALFVSSTIALGLACLVLVAKPTALLDSQALLNDPEFRADVIAELIDTSGAVFDSHPDPLVGRVLQPGVDDIPFAGVMISTNSVGVREREYKMPKPEGVVRIVLLGDSYVFGWGVEAEDRMGTFLEDWLADRATDFDGRIEVLHFGVGSWGITTETTFVRRQLSELAPDLVVQLLIENDLDDNVGVRGFGTRSRFAPELPFHTNARVNIAWPVPYSMRGNRNPLLEGTDWESRSRYSTAVTEICKLADAVVHQGGDYLLIPSWGARPFKLWRELIGNLDPRHYAPLPESFRNHKDEWVAPNNSHWNRAGHERFARFVYGLIEAKGLLPALSLEPWDEVRLEAEENHKQGLHESRLDREDWYWNQRPTPVASITFPDPVAHEIARVYTGLDDEGNLYPYASLVLDGAESGDLLVEGRRLNRPELAGGTVTVWVEEFQVGTIPLTGGVEVSERFPLPTELKDRVRRNVRLVSDDWVLTEYDLRRCLSMRIDRIAIE